MPGKRYLLECVVSAMKFRGACVMVCETIMWKKERSRIRAAQMDNLRGLLFVWSDERSGRND